MTKEERYQEAVPQIESLMAGETDMIANMANIAAILHSTFGFWWTGFYLVKEENERTMDDGRWTMDNGRWTMDNGRWTMDNGRWTKELVLGPFQGPIACTRIPYNKGVCGRAWAQEQTIIVGDVHDFPGHIACSSESKSEIVVPVRRKKDIIAVLDIDSAQLNTFDIIDQQYLEQIADLFT